MQKMAMVLLALGTLSFHVNATMAPSGGTCYTIPNCSGTPILQSVSRDECIDALHRKRIKLASWMHDEPSHRCTLPQLNVEKGYGYILSRSQMFSPQRK